MGLRLARPSFDYTQEIAAYRREFLAAGEHAHGDQGLGKFPNIEEWIDFCRLMEKQETVPRPGWAEADQYMLLGEGSPRILGMINFRHHLNENLAEYGGHIGYAVRPSERRRGYATTMLTLCLERCREYGLSRVLITCNADNEPSRRTIVRSGGVFERIAEEPDHTLVRRDWVAV
jgi:predicted acetyltransferase